MADIDGVFTLLDIANESHNSKLLTVAKAVSQTNRFIQDAHWEEGNSETGYHLTREVSLPSGNLLAVGEGYSPSAVHSAPVTEDMMLIEDRMELPERLVAYANDPSAWRLNKVKRFLRGLGNQATYRCFYGNHGVNGKDINGLATRMPALVTDRVVSNGCADALTVTSVYGVRWGADNVHMFYPKNSKTVGIVHEDDGLMWVNTDAAVATKRMKAYVDRFYWNAGIAVHDVRDAFRLANIGTDGEDEIDPELLVDLLIASPDEGAGFTLYMNKRVLGQLTRACANKPNVLQKLADPYGRIIYTFYEHPIHIVTQIINTEPVLV